MRDARGADFSDIYGILGSGRAADEASQPFRAERANLPATAEWRGPAIVWSRTPVFDQWLEGLNAASARLESRFVEQPEPARPITLKAILGIVALSILLIGGAAAGAYAVASMAQTVYAARVEIGFDLRHLGWDSSERFLATQPLIVSSGVVLTPIASAFAIPARELEERLSVATVGSSGVIRLEFVHPPETMALEIIRALTARYLAELTAADRVEPIRRWILTPALVLEAPVSPRPLRAAAIGALAGLLLAGGAISLHALTRRRGATSPAPPGGSP
jgi:hypothetical protein